MAKLPGSTPINQLRNFGPKSLRWFEPLGIKTLGDLKSWDMYDIYMAMKVEGRPVSRVMLYAIWGAVNNKSWLEVPDKLKTEMAINIKKRLKQ